MIKFANYINKIEISSLWSGHKHIVWQLRPDVNVLSGHNGAGKSTILNRLVQHLRTVPTTGDLQGTGRLGVKIDFDPSDATGIHYDVIRSFDRQMVNFENSGSITDARIVTELDWQLYLIQRRYLDYQVISPTSVTASSQPSIISAGECVVSIICALGLSSRTKEMRRFCHSKCKLASGSSINNT